MSKDEQRDSQDLVTKDAAIPFTSRLNAYYRAQESLVPEPLLIDPLAGRLAGDMTEYFMKHKHIAGMGGSVIVRSHYIETALLSPWCTAHERSQIILLGAGLDTLAYRFKPLQKGSHSVFELDLPVVINYKEAILHDDSPLCNLTRIPADLSHKKWVSSLLKHGFLKEIPTFWILEGLVYYIKREEVRSLLQKLAEVSPDDSEIFVDVCVPALADLKWGPYSKHFRWGINKEEVSSFFAATGWEVSSSFIDNHAHGRDVGQKGLILIHGAKNPVAVKANEVLSPVEGPDLSETELRVFSINFAKRIIPEIEKIVKTLNRNLEDGLSRYLDFISRIEPDVRIIVKGQKNPVLLGHISPRLLGNPLSIEEEAHLRSHDEIESCIAGFLKAILQLAYCGIKGIQGNQFHGTPMHTASQTNHDTTDIDVLPQIMKTLRNEL